MLQKVKNQMVDRTVGSVNVYLRVNIDETFVKFSRHAKVARSKNKYIYLFLFSYVSK